MAETAEGDGRPRAVVLLEELGGPRAGDAWEEIVFQCAERSMELAQRSSFADSHHNYAEGLLMAVKMRREQDEIQASWRSGARSIFRLAQARAEVAETQTLETYLHEQGAHPKLIARIVANGITLEQAQRVLNAAREMEAPPTTGHQSGGAKAEKLVPNYSTSASNEQ